MTKPLLFSLLVVLLSCHREVSVDTDSYTCGQVNIMRLYNLKGIPIKYNKQLNEYYMEMSADTTTANARKDVGVFCDLPDSLKMERKTISFDGKFSFVNIRDSVGRDSRLRRYFSPARVYHVGILQLK